MQINRLFGIIYLLLDKKQATSKELAEHFEVSMRTILRDIETLSAAGIPIYTLQGKGGGISILDHYVLNKTVLTEEEQHHVLFALQSLSSTDHIDVSGILSKLRTLFDKTSNSWIEIDFSHWANREPDHERFETLKEAIIKKQAISFSYLNPYGAIANRTAYPLKVIFKAKSWYLQGYCLSKEDYRTFKITRMQHIEMLTESFADKQFQLPPIQFSADVAYSHIHLNMRFASHVAYRVYDEFNQKDIIRSEDGSLLVSVRLPDDEWLYSLLLSFGTAVRILEPQYVNENLLQRIEEIKTIHTQHIP